MTEIILTTFRAIVLGGVLLFWFVASLTIGAVIMDPIMNCVMKFIWKWLGLEGL